MSTGWTRGVTLVAVVAGLAFAGPAGAAPLPQGIRGYVTLGPTCPVQRVGETCERPYAATMSLRRLGSTATARTLRSGDDGRFRVALRVGRYRLTPRHSSPFPHAEPQTVIVRAGRFTRVTVAFDTGIR